MLTCTNKFIHCKFSMNLSSDQSIDPWMDGDGCLPSDATKLQRSMVQQLLERVHETCPNHIPRGFARDEKYTNLCIRGDESSSSPLSCWWRRRRRRRRRSYCWGCPRRSSSPEPPPPCSCPHTLLSVSVSVSLFLFLFLFLSLCLLCLCVVHLDITLREYKEKVMGLFIQLKSMATSITNGMVWYGIKETLPGGILALLHSDIGAIHSE